MSSSRSELDSERTPLLVDVTVPSTPSKRITAVGCPVSVGEEAGPASTCTTPPNDNGHATVSVLQVVLVLLIGT
jgi:hypothetical protein